MAKNKDASAIVSALGVLMSIITALVSAVKKQGGMDADIYRLATPEGESLIERIAALIVEAGKPEKLAENCYRVVVDYERSLAQMITAGKYDYANSDITAQNFPIQGSGPSTGSGQAKQEVVVELVHYGRDMETDAVLKDLESKGMRPATLPELLSFGSTNPEKQREFPIIALGSVWRHRIGNRRVAYLDRWVAKRKLNLSWIDVGWHDGCRFAAVRK